MDKPMKKREKYFGTYTDSTGTTAIVIENDFTQLYTSIDGVMFAGTEFSTMAVINKASYSSEQLKRFTFHKIPISSKSGTNIEETLCECVFHFPIQHILINPYNNEETITALDIKCTIGKENPKTKGLEYENVSLSLSKRQFTFTGSGEVFEIAFDRLKANMQHAKQAYGFKNCYGCLYGDYSYLGADSFGSMQCYIRQKEEYLKVKNKAEYMQLSSDFDWVQETYCCDQYAMRLQGTGYRG